MPWSGKKTLENCKCKLNSHPHWRRQDSGVFVAFFAGDLGFRYHIIGLIDDAPISAKVAGRFLFLGRVADAERIVRDAGVQTVLIAAPGMERDRMQKLIMRIQPYVKDISFIPDLIGTPMAGAQVDMLFREKILMLKLQNNLARKRNRVCKRGFDH